MNTLRSSGLKVIEEVLGEEYFKARGTSLSDFNEDLRSLTEEYCFGAIWTRPGLDRKTRSLILLGMLTALGKGAELKLHVVGALNNGCTKEEIKEVLLQAAVYCGIPAGVEAFRNAEVVLKERDLVTAVEPSV